MNILPFFFIMTIFNGLCSGGDFTLTRYPDKVLFTLTQAPEVNTVYNFTPSYYDLDVFVVSFKDGVSYPVRKQIHVTQWEGTQAIFPVSSPLVFVTVEIKPEKGSYYVIQKKLSFAQIGNGN